MSWLGKVSMVVKYLRKQLKRYVGKMVGVLSRKNVQ